MSYQKHNCAQPGKKHTKKAKRASADWCNTLIFTAKNAITKPSKQIKKNFPHTTKRIVVIKITYAKSPEHKKKQNITRQNCKNPGSGTEANPQKAKPTKARNLVQKIKQTVHKSTAKNKAATKLQMQC